MAAHSSILAWKIPWTEEPGGVTVRQIAESDTAEHTAQQQRCSLQSVLVLPCLCVEDKVMLFPKKKSHYTSTSTVMALHFALRADVSRF